MGVCQGLAPTLMVARLSLDSTKSVTQPATVGISALDFQDRNTGVSQDRSSSGVEESEGCDASLRQHEKSQGPEIV